MVRMSAAERGHLETVNVYIWSDSDVRGGKLILQQQVNPEETLQGVNVSLSGYQGKVMTAAPAAQPLLQKQAYFKVCPLNKTHTLSLNWNTWKSITGHLSCFEKEQTNYLMQITILKCKLIFFLYCNALQHRVLFSSCFYWTLPKLCWRKASGRSSI